MADDRLRAERESKAKVLIAAAYEEFADRADVKVPHVEQDGMLEHWVQIANASGLQIGMTLTVGGGIVSGELVSKDKWLDEFAELLSNAVDEPDLQQAFRDMIHDWKSGDDAERDHFERIGYIHLRSARVVGGSEAIPSYSADGFLWRGRLNQVTGWAMGQVGSRSSKVG